MTVDATGVGAASPAHFATDVHIGLADSRHDGVGRTAGMRPHELLEAALATGLAITARMAIEQLGFADPTVAVRVWPDRSEATTVVNQRLISDPRLDHRRRRAVAELRQSSPLWRTLTRTVDFAAEAPAAHLDGQLHLPI